MKALICFILFAVFSLSTVAQNRYLAKVDKKILQEMGVESKSISVDWQLFDVKDTSLLAGLRKAGVYTELDRQAKINSIPNDSLFHLQWGVTGGNGLWRGNFEDAWKITEGSKKVTIGLLDTGSPRKNGVWTHPDLDSTRFSAISFITGDDSDATEADFSGHGTHAAGIFSATKNNGKGIAGIDQYCQVIVYKVFSKYGSGWYSDIAQAIYRSVHDSCKVLSMSFGGIFYSRLLEDAIYYAQKNGVVCVVASGNDGAEVAEYPAFFSRFSTRESYRTGFPNIISVGAINNFGSVADYSNRGWFVDIYAPGGSGAYPFANPSNILSTFPNYACILGRADSNWYYYDEDSIVVISRTPEQKTYGYLAGTSMATPFVTGTVSLMLAANSELWPNNIKDILTKTADVVMTVDGPVAILNPGAAVQMAKNSTTTAAVEKETNISVKFNLNQNYPNPFNPSTAINFSLPTSSFVTLKVYNMLGQEVTTLVDEEKSAGTHQIKFDASGLSSGMYIYKIQAGNFSQTNKMLLMK